jgi:hypothetical protein
VPPPPPPFDVIDENIEEEPFEPLAAGPGPPGPPPPTVIEYEVPCVIEKPVEVL